MKNEVKILLPEKKGLQDKIKQNLDVVMEIKPGSIHGKTDLPGVFFDFNLGARVTVPKGKYRVRLMDRDNDLILYDAAASGSVVSSTKHCYVNFRIEVYQDKKMETWEKAEAGKNADGSLKKPKEDYKLLFSHDFDCKSKKVFMKMSNWAIGDSLAWFPYVEEFRRIHGCEIICDMPERIASILKPGYPEIKFIPYNSSPGEVYASYYLGIFLPYDNINMQPQDFRTVGLARHAAYILGVPAIEHRVKLLPSTKERLIKEPYVCIGVHASTQCKYWNNPTGWDKTVKYLKNLGYRVLAIDKEATCHGGVLKNTLPKGAEDFTGDKPLQERVDLLYHADFFIGLASGLAWMGYGLNIPVIMIVGFTAPGTEFYTPYRVQQFHSCNSCWNDRRMPYENGDYDWCPRLKGTPRQFECTRLITPEYVMATIDQVMKDYKLDPKKNITRKPQDVTTWEAK